MAFKKKGQLDNQSTDADQDKKTGTHAYEGNQRNSIPSDASSNRDSTNTPFSGFGGSKGGYKPQYVGGPVDTQAGGGGGVHPRIRGGRMGQGGFARVFTATTPQKAVGSEAAAPKGSLNGIFGY